MQSLLSVTLPVGQVGSQQRFALCQNHSCSVDRHTSPLEPNASVPNPPLLGRLTASLRPFRFMQVPALDWRLD